MKYIVECFNDECFLKAYKVDTFDINHQYEQGKGDVFNILSVQKNRVGIVDFDSSIDDAYFENFQHHDKVCDDINVYFETSNNNYLIVFNPKIEKIIVRITKETDSVETAKKLGFNNTEGNYHKIQSNREKLNKFVNLLQTLIQRSSELQTLKKYLN